MINSSGFMVAKNPAIFKSGELIDLFLFDCDIFSIPCRWIKGLYRDNRTSITMLSDTWIMAATCLLYSLLSVVSANWDKVCTPFTKRFGPHPHGICGSRIDETLDLLCIAGYNEIPSYNDFRKKRDIDGGYAKDLRGILIPRKNANSFLVKRSSFYERGIVCECCYNACSIMELLSYCRGGPGLFGLFKRSVDRQLKTRANQHNHQND